MLTWALLPTGPEGADPAPAAGGAGPVRSPGHCLNLGSDRLRGVRQGLERRSVVAGTWQLGRVIRQTQVVGNGTRELKQGVGTRQDQGPGTIIIIS